MTRMTTLNRQVLLGLPNLLTFARIAVIPIIAFLMMAIGPHNTLQTNRFLSFTAAGIFIFAAVSDLVDGYFARRYGMVSLFGKFVDPMADKLIHMTVMILMIPLGRLPAWFVVVLLFREIFITGLRAVAAGEGMIMGAGEWGKKKTAWTNVGLSALLLYYPIYGVSSYTVGWVAMVVATFYNIVSGVQYTVMFFKEIIRHKT